MSLVQTELTGRTYGTVAGVQSYIHALTFTTSSKPTLAEVADMLATRSLALDMRIRAGGYTVPVVDADGLAVLASIAELQVAASVIERLVMGRTPDAAKVESAATWRKEAEELLKGLIDGSASMPGGDDRTGGGVAGFSSGDSEAFPREDTDAFIDAHRY